MYLTPFASVVAVVVCFVCLRITNCEDNNIRRSHRFLKIPSNNSTRQSATIHNGWNSHIWESPINPSVGSQLPERGLEVISHHGSLTLNRHGSRRRRSVEHGRWNVPNTNVYRPSNDYFSLAETVSPVSKQKRHYETRLLACLKSCHCVYDRNGNVTMVDCSGRGLTSIPKLPETSLDVNLQRNNISSVSCNTFNHLRRLETLDLSQNLLQGVFSCSFDSLESLKSLILDDCNITSLPNAIFGSLLNLQNLDLRRNSISHVDKGIFKSLRKLKFLSLMGNKIGKIRNGTFEGLASLAFLSLESNLLRYLPSTFEPLAFHGLSSLETLMLQGNEPEFTTNFTYPDEALSKIPWLRHLNMDGHPKPLGPGFAALVNLTILSFFSGGAICSLPSHLIPTKFFENVNTKQPLAISLTNCSIDKIPPEFFKYLPTINALDLSHNKDLGFDGFEEGSLGLKNTNLEYLKLTYIYNPKTSVAIVTNSSFQHLRSTKLRYLYIDHNYIAYIDPIAINNLPITLEYLSLFRNSLISPNFSGAMLRLLNLKVLVVSKQLWYHNSRNTTLKNLPNVSHRMDIVKDMIIDKGYDRLTSIVQMISQNETENNRGGLSKIAVRDLNYSGNGARDAVDFCGHRQKFPDGIRIPLPLRLEEVYLGNSKISYDIPPVHFVNNHVLKLFDISLNGIKCFAGPISGLPAFEYLDMSGNFGLKISPNFFANLTSMKILLLGDNVFGQSLADSVSKHIFSALTNLELLDLRNNAVTDLAESMFANNVKLTKLDLSQNQMTSFRPNLINNTKLTMLDLSTNILTGFTKSTCSQFEDIRRRNPEFQVRIRSNKFVCDCDNLEFFNLLVQQPCLFQDFASFECHLRNGSSLKYDQLEKFLPRLGLNCLSETMLLPLLVVLFLIVSTLGIVSVYRYYRLTLRYLYYVGKSKLHIWETDNDVQMQNKKDVYATFDTESLQCREFMAETFLPRLRQLGLSIVCGETDFIPGQRTSDQCTTAITRSRKTLVVLTKDIFQEYDRELEMNVAIMHELRSRRHVLVPVVLLEQDIQGFLEDRENEAEVEVEDDFRELAFQLFDSFPPEISVYLHGQARRCFIYDGGSTEFWDSLDSSLRGDDVHGIIYGDDDV